VRFSVDGVQMTEYTRSVPNAQMHVMSNAWWPTWLPGGPSATDHAAAIEWIRY
jgi:hypothetical protein